MFRDRPTLIIIRLEEYNYPAATAIAAIMVLLSFAMLVLVNLVQSWCRKRYADSPSCRRSEATPPAGDVARYLMAVAFWWPERHWPPEARPPCPPLR